MSVNYEVTAKQLIEILGGEGNINSMTHCMTRLRFVLNDESGINDKEVEKIPGVMGTMRKSGQYQVIIGNNVAKCYQELQKLGSFENVATEKKDGGKQNIVNTVIDFIAACMTPMIPAIIAGGMLKVVLIILGPTILGVLAAEGDTYILLNGLGDAAFYFLPIFVAITASKKLNCNTYLSVMVAGFLIYPDVITLLGGETATSLFGVIPIVHASYSSSIIPAMLAVILLKYVEIGVDKITPVWSKNFIKPLLIVIIVGLVTLCALAPLGTIIGNGLLAVLDFIYGFAPWLAMALFAGFMPFIVMTGMHWAFLPTTLMALANPGYDLMLLPAMLASNVAQAGATFAVAVRSKDSNMKQIAFPAAISALIAGVTEPAMYGVNLKLKKPMYAACLAGGICGIFEGIIALKSYSFAVPSLTSVVQFIGADQNNFMFAIITLVAAFALAFVFTLIFAKKELVQIDEDVAITEDTNTLTFENPIEGTVIPLEQVDDATFSSEVLGKGYAIIPKEGNVYAPFDGTVETLMDTKHALGLVSDSGIIALIHVGLETVKLDGKYFTPHVKTGDTFKKGQLLLSFDQEKIAAEGYDITTPVIVSNPDEFQIKINEVKEARQGSNVLELQR